MAAEEYKALAPFNLPFIDRRYEPGDKVKFSDIERYASEAEKANPDGHNLTAAEAVEHFVGDGVLSEDMDAELHPSHLPIDPNEPNLASIAAQADFLVKKMEERGEKVPAKLRAIAETRIVSTNDAGRAGDR